MSKKLVSATLSAIIAAGISNAALADDLTAKDMEKCYGVSKAGKNDCGAGTLSCSGQSKQDGDKNAWILLPKGTCDRIVGGSINPPPGS